MTHKKKIKNNNKKFKKVLTYTGLTTTLLSAIPYNVQSGIVTVAAATNNNTQPNYSGLTEISKGSGTTEKATMVRIEAALKTENDEFGQQPTAHYDAQKDQFYMEFTYGSVGGGAWRDSMADETGRVLYSKVLVSEHLQNQISSVQVTTPYGASTTTKYQYDSNLNRNAYINKIPFNTVGRNGIYTAPVIRVYINRNKGDGILSSDWISSVVRFTKENSQGNEVLNSGYPIFEIGSTLKSSDFAPQLNDSLYKALKQKAINTVNQMPYLSQSRKSYYINQINNVSNTYGFVARLRDIEDTAQSENDSILTNRRNQFINRINNGVLSNYSNASQKNQTISKINQETNLNNIPNLYKDLLRQAVTQMENLGTDDESYYLQGMGNENNVNDVESEYSTASEKNNSMASRKNRATETIEGLNLTPNRKTYYKNQISQLTTLPGNIENSQPQIDSIVNRAKFESYKNDKKDELDQYNDPSIRETGKIIDNAKTNIDKSSTNSQSSVNSIVEAAKNDIEKAKANAQKKQINNNLDQAADDAIAKINNLPNLSGDENSGEKHEKISAVETARDTAKNNVNNAESVSNIKDIEKSGKDNIQKVVDDANNLNTRNNIKSQLNDVFKETRQNILSSGKLTGDENSGEKQAAITNAQTALDNALENVDNPDANLSQVLDDGSNNIRKVLPNAELAHDISEAKQQLQDYRNNDIQNGLKNLGLQDNQDIQTQLNSIVTDGQSDIATSTDSNSAFDKLSQYKQKLDDVISAKKQEKQAQFNQDKSNKKASLDQAFENAQTAIKNMTNLDNTEQESYITEARNQKNIYQKRIEDDQYQSDLDADFESGKQAIQAVVDNASLVDYQNQLNKDLDSSGTAAKTTVNNLSGLSNDDKHAAEQSIETLVSNGQTAITGTKDNPTAKATYDSYNQQIQNVIKDYNGRNNTVVQRNKDTSNTKLTDVADGAKNDIDQLKNISDDDKKSYKDAIEQSRQTGQDNINSQTTPKGVQDEFNKAQDDIRKSVDDARLKDARESAKKQLTDATNNAKNDINQMPGLSDTDKSNAKQSIDDAVNNNSDDSKNYGKQIDSATNKDDIKSKLDEAQSKINEKVNEYKNQSTSGVATQKTSLDDYARKALETINALPNIQIDASKLNNYTSQVNDAKTNAQNKIDEAKTQLEVNNAFNTGTQTIDKVVQAAQADDLQVKKNNAKQDLKTYADTTMSNINQLSTLTDDEKNAAEKSVRNDSQSALNRGLAQIDASPNSATVDANVVNRKQDMDNTYAYYKGLEKQRISDRQSQSKASIDQYADSAKKQIDNLTNLDSTAKDTLKQEIEAKRQTVQNSINSNNINDINNAVQQAQKDFQDTVDKGKIQDAKSAAKKEIDDYVKSTQQKVDNLSGLNQSQKQTAKDNIENSVKTPTNYASDIDGITEDSNAKQNIQAKVNQAKEQVDNAFNSVNSENQQAIDNDIASKKSAIDSAAQAAIDKINALNNLPQGDKDTAITEVNNKKDTAKNNIGNYNNNGQADLAEAAKNQGLDDITTTVNNSRLKDSQIGAKKQFSDYVDDKIAGLTGVDEQTKNDIINSVKNNNDSALNQGNTNIDSATTTSGVQKALDDAKSNVDSIIGTKTDQYQQATEQAQTDAKNKIDNAATNAKNDIDNLSPVDQDAKQSAKNAVDQAAENAKTNINGKNTDSDIRSALTDGQNAINDVVNDAQNKNQVAVDKQNAVKDLHQHANDKKDVINQLPGLTQEQKNDYTNQINQKVNDTITSIKGAQDRNGVTSSVNRGKDDITNVANDATDKSNAAKNASANIIETSSNDAKTTVDGFNNLPTNPDRKQQIKDDIDNAATNAKNNINNASDKASMDKATKAGQEKINEIVLNGKKEDAKSDLDKHAKEAKDKIANLNGLSDTDKENAKASIDQAKETIDQANKTGKDNVDKSQTIESIDTSAQNGKNTMDEVYNAYNGQNNKIVQNSRDTAIKQLEEVANNAKNNVDKLTIISDNDKNSAKDDIDRRLQKAEDDIKNVSSTSNKPTDNIEELTQTAQSDINNRALDAKKKDANLDLDNTINKAKSDIDQFSGLSDTDKSAAKQAIENSIKSPTNYREEISKANSFNDVDTQVNKAKESINNVKIDSKRQSDTSTYSSNIDELANQAKSRINAISPINNEDAIDKSEYRKLVDQAAAQIKQELKQKSTADEMQQVVESNRSTIEQPASDAETLANQKRAAIDDLANYASTKQNEIQDINNLPQDQKDQFKSEISNFNTNGQTQIIASKDQTAVNANVVTYKRYIDGVIESANGQSTKLINDSKQTEITNISNVADKAIESINKLNPLDENKKNSYINEINNQRNEAINKLKDPNNSSLQTQEQVNSYSKDVQKNINDQVSSAKLDNARQQAKNDIVAYAEDTKTAIQHLDSLSDTQKSDAIKKVDNTLNGNRENSQVGYIAPDGYIDQQNSIADIDKKVTDAKTDLDRIKSGSNADNQAAINQRNNQARADAISYLEKVRDQAKTAIQNTHDASNTNSQIDNAFSDAKYRINNVNPQNILSERQTGENQINQIRDKALLDDIKEKDKASLRDYAQKAKDEIKKFQAVDQNIIENTIKQIGTDDSGIVNSGLDQISKSNSKQDADNQLSISKNNIDTIVNNIRQQNNNSLNNSKDESNKNLNISRNSAIDAINHLYNLSPDEKELFKNMVNAVPEVPLSNNAADMSSKQKELQTQVNNYVNAATLLDTHHEAISEISDLPNIDSTDYNNRVNEVLQNKTNPQDIGNQFANQSESDSSSNLSSGQNNIAQIIDEARLKSKKETAKKAIDAESQKQKDEIDRTRPLSPTDVDKAKSDIDTQANKGKADIDNPQTVNQEQIDTIVKNTTDNMQTTVDKAKDKSELEQNQQDKKSEVDKMNPLSDQDKQKAKDDIDKQTQAGKDAIDKTNSKADADNERDKAKDNVQTTVDKAKDKSELEQNQQDKKSEVDKMNPLSDQDKQKAKDDIDKQTQAGKDTIDKTNSKADADNERDKAKDNVQTTVDKAKDKSELEQNQQDKKSEVDKMNPLSDQDKQKAKDDIDKQTQAGKDAIDKTNSKADADNERDKAKDNVQTTVDKAKDKSELEQNQQDKKSEVDKMNPLSDQDKQKAKDDIDKQTQAGKDAIDKTNSKADADNERDKAKDNVQTTVDKAKDKSELEQNQQDKKSEVDKMNPLSDQDKQKAKDDIDKQTQAGKDAIDKAPSSKDSNAAKENAKDDMQNTVNKYDKIRRDNIKQNEDTQNELLNKKSRISYITNETANNLIKNADKTQQDQIDSIRKNAINKVKDATTFNGLDDIMNEVNTNFKPFNQSGINKVVSYINGYGVQNWQLQPDGSFKAINNSYTATNSNVIAYETMAFNGQNYTKAQTRDGIFWIQSKYLDDNTPETPVDGVLTAKAPSNNYAIYLRDKKGNMMSQFVLPGTQWRVFAQKVIDGKLYYRIGNNNQWIESAYVTR